MGGLNIGRRLPEFKRDDEQFHHNGDSAGFTSDGYWQWIGSDMLSNILRVVLVIIVMASFACGRENPVGAPDHHLISGLRRGLPLANEPATDDSSATIDSVAAADTIHVDLVGTRIRLVNSSGGNLIAANKTLIILADWNIHAWRDQTAPPPGYRGLTLPEGTLYKNPVDITSLEWRNHIDTHWEFSLQCASTDQAFSGSAILYEGMIRFTGAPFAAQGRSVWRLHGRVDADHA